MYCILAELSVLWVSEPFFVVCHYGNKLANNSSDHRDREMVLARILNLVVIYTMAVTVLVILSRKLTQHTR